ncbi:MAG: hypothetical protein M1330_01215 [Armatimonadetes bacterium]|nr:hypothetical protein [Armatimonadota bacterium]
MTLHTIQRIRKLGQCFGAMLILSLMAAEAFAQIAIFSEAGFPYYGANIGSNPSQIQRWLKKAGLSSALLNARQLSDPSVFNARRYSLLIYPYGNTFPLEAAANLRRYHLDGGSILAPGVAFCHPCVKKNGQWQDLGHNPVWLDDQHIGWGGFSEAPPGRLKLADSPNDPLHLNYLPLSQLNAYSQSPSPPQTPNRRLIPILVQENSSTGVVVSAPAAIVEHVGGPFRGAYDVWAGTEVFSDSTEAALTGYHQVVVTATAWVLKRKGLLSSEKLASIEETLRHEYRPPPIYTNLPTVHLPKSYPGVFPTMPAPARHLWVIDAQKLNPQQQLTLVSLQGLVNRTKPRIYVIWGPVDTFWLKWLQRGGFTGAPRYGATIPELIHRYRVDLHGVIVNDPRLFIGPDIASMLAAVKDGIIVSPDQSHYGLPIAFDMRNRWSGNAQALQWCFHNLISRLDRHQLCCIYPGGACLKVLDYCIAKKIITFWITGTVDGVRPGCNPIAEQAVVSKLLAKLPANIPVRGFPYAGVGVGIQEGPGVTLFSRFAKYTVASDLIGNVSVHAGTRVSNFHQRLTPAPPLDRTKNYVAFIMSDGDNQCTYYDFFINFWDRGDHGQTPIGWTIGPTAVDTMPDIMDYYYRHATPNDDFICAVSGVGYMYPDVYAANYRNRQAVFDRFLGQTQKYMRRLDLNCIWLMGIESNQLLADYATQISHLQAVFPDYGRITGMTYQKADYRLGPSVPIFHALTASPSGVSREEAISAMVNQIRRMVARAKPPTFVNAFAINWTYSPGMLSEVAKKLGPDFVVVTPDQLATLYNEAYPPH